MREALREVEGDGRVVLSVGRQPERGRARRATMRNRRVQEARADAFAARLLEETRIKPSIPSSFSETMMN